MLLAGDGQVPWSECIDAVGSLLVALTAIHIGHGCTVEDKVGLVPGKEGVHRIRRGDVQFVHIDCEDLASCVNRREFPPQFTGSPPLKYVVQFAAKLSLGPPGYKNYHACILIVYAAFGNLSEVFAVGGALPVAGSTCKQFLPADPTIAEPNLLRGGRYLDSLPLLDHADKVSCIHQAVHRTGIEPGKTPPSKKLYMQFPPFFQVKPVQVGYLELPPAC